ncbi:hypothetical protein D7X33_12200 [Butyricicoccus sp. 1XD8-22]|nr:hypothetical protein D7X33_12200 [Butyricicoccus sp. 1XD8-22]
MKNLYPYVETLKVGAAYAALLYIWPSIVFRKLLCGKGLTFRFLFCSIVQPVLISTAVLGLGLVHLLHFGVVRVLFWGALAAPLLVACCREKRVPVRLPLRALLAGHYGWKLFFCRAADGLARRWQRFRQRYAGKTAEYLVLAGILLFGMAFFLNGAFQDYSFGCFDQYTHYRWTEKLLAGDIFTWGVYPEGMHCFLYALHVLFGVKLHSCVLFLAGLHNSTSFLLAAYCLLNALFRSRHTTLLVLTAWLAFDGIGPVALEAFTRMTWTLPQEFGHYLILACPLLLLRYCRERCKPVQWYRDENLLLLAVGIANAVSMHFYVLILAACACVPVVFAYWRELFPPRRMLPPIAAGLYGAELGLLPMLIACAVGFPLEGSLLWGFNTLRGASGDSIRNRIAAAAPKEVHVSLWERLSAPLKGFYENGYVPLFGDYAAWMLLLSLLVPALLLACWYARRRGRLREGALPAGTAKGYLILALGCMVFILLFAAPYIGLPELVVIDRTLAITQLLAFGLVAVPVDFLLARASSLRGKPLPRGLMAAGCLCLYLAAYMTDFRQSTFCYLQRYNSTVAVTDQIMNRYPEGNYCIVSTLDERYQVPSQNHEELLNFMKNTEGEAYTIPKEYIFLYVEKQPIQRGQVHFHKAPHWLARENNKRFSGANNQSQCPDILHTEISEEMADANMPYVPNLRDNYDNQMLHTVLASRAYAWYQRFSATYPAETNVYYENDEFVCYVIHQNMDMFLELAQKEGDSGDGL